MPNPVVLLVDRLGQTLGRRAEILDGCLFGSVACESASAHSDVDVAVYVDRSMWSTAPFGYLSELTAELMSALGSSRVDAVLLNDASPLLYRSVLCDGVRVFSRDLAGTQSSTSGW